MRFSGTEKVNKANDYHRGRWRSLGRTGYSFRPEKCANVHQAVPGRLQEIPFDKGCRLESVLCVHYLHGERYESVQVRQREAYGNSRFVQKTKEHREYEHFEIGKGEIDNPNCKGNVFGKQRYSF